MSYIQDCLTKEDFINKFESKYQQIVRATLTSYESFCQSKFGFSGDKVLQDLVEDHKQTHSMDKIYTLFNQYVQFLQEDHPEITVYWRFKSRPFKKKHPSTTSNYVKCLRYFFEDCGNFEFNLRKLKSRIRLPKIPKEDPEPLTHEEIRELCDIATHGRKTMYMVLKDSGMRIGECMSLRKKDVDLTKEPIEIHLPATITKTKKSRITFVTRETAPMFQRIVVSIKDDEGLIFGSSYNIERSIQNEEQIFQRFRSKLGKSNPKWIERYDHNNRFKKNIHSLRAFTATQGDSAIDETWGHALIGHSKQLGQYIRNKDTFVQKYLRTEPKLMVYEKEVVVENTDSEIDILKKQVNRLIRETIQQKEQLEARNKFLEAKLFRK